MMGWGGLTTQTLGQAIYIAVMANPDGLAPAELVARIQESKPELDGGTVLCAAMGMSTRGYIRLDGERWYAPGPTHAVWEML